MKTRILLELPQGVWGIEVDDLNVTRGDKIIHGVQGHSFVNLEVIVKVANLFKNCYDVHCKVTSLTGTLDEMGFACLTV